jgi:hypothetical protein
MSIATTARQAGAYVDTIARAEAVVLAIKAAEQARTDALADLERVAGDPIAELTGKQGTYFAAAEHDEDLWMAMELAQMKLTPPEDAIASLERR